LERSAPIPRPIEWFQRLPAILAQLDVPCQPAWIDRAAIERLFGVSRRNAHYLMARFGALRLGNLLVVEPASLAAKLRLLTAQDEVVRQVRRHERVRAVIQERRAGLKLARIDLSAFALMRAGLPAVKLALQAEEVTEEPVVALIDIGATSTNVVISRGGICELNRLVAFGRQHFTQTLVEQFGWELSDAERVSTEAGIAPLGGMEAPGDPYADARRVMQFVADQFAQEIRTSFDYYSHSTDGTHRVGRMVVAGEGALLRGIEQRFAHELGLPVSVLDASPRLDAVSVEELGELHPRYGTALGLAMEEAA